jgi:hypothetical protein
MTKPNFTLYSLYLSTFTKVRTSPQPNVETSERSTVAANYVRALAVAQGRDPEVKQPLDFAAFGTVLAAAFNDAHKWSAIEAALTESGALEKAQA